MTILQENVIVYTWNGNHSYDESAIAKKHPNINFIFKNLSNEDFYKIMEEAGIHKLSHELKRQYDQEECFYYDRIYVIHNSINIDDVDFSVQTEFNTVHFLNSISENYFYCDSLTFNIMSLICKFKKFMATDTDDVLYYHMFSHGINIKIEGIDT